MQGDRSDKLVVTQTGSGGLEELQDVLDSTKASYAYVRVQYSNDKESVREKFCFVTWIGPQCKIMRKAKVCIHLRLMIPCSGSTQISVHAADVKQVLRVYSIEVPAQSKDDLKQEPIVIRLRKVRRAGAYVLPSRLIFGLFSILGWRG